MYLLNVLFYNLNLEMQEFHEVILKLVWLLFFSFKGFTWIVFLFEWYSDIIIIIILLNLLSHYCISDTFIVWFVREWKMMMIFLPCWMTLGQVFLILDHIWAWICSVRSPPSPVLPQRDSCFLFLFWREDVAAVIPRQSHAPAGVPHVILFC